MLLTASLQENGEPGPRSLCAVQPGRGSRISLPGSPRGVEGPPHPAPAVVTASGLTRMGPSVRPGPWTSDSFLPPSPLALCPSQGWPAPPGPSPSPLPPPPCPLPASLPAERPLCQRSRRKRRGGAGRGGPPREGGGRAFRERRPKLSQIESDGPQRPGSVELPPPGPQEPEFG